MSSSWKGRRLGFGKRDFLDWGRGSRRGILRRNCRWAGIQCPYRTNMLSAPSKNQLHRPESEVVPDVRSCVLESGATVLERQKDFHNEDHNTHT
jgi:hypothetical protein